MSIQRIHLTRLALISALLLSVLLSPASRALAGPDSAGIVLWYDGPFSFGMPDEKSGLAAFFGIDIAAACRGDEAPVSIVRYKDVTIPQADQRIVSTVHARDLPVTVWRIAELDALGCPIGTAAPVASGLVRLRYTDNDAIAFISDNQNVNAWGFTAQGKLTDRDGRRVQFNSVFRNVWDGVDAMQLNHFVIRVELR